MSSSDAEQTARSAAELIDEYGGLGPFVRNFGLGGILFAVFTQVIEAIDAAGQTLLAPWRALAGGIADLVGGTLGSGVAIVDAGGDTAANSFTSGFAEALGPLAFPAAVLVVMFTVYLFIQAVSATSFSPLAFIRGRL